MTDDLAPPPGPAAPLPAVSVVLPAYNRADSIRLAIDSVLRQSFADFELIIVDDASTDGTRAVAEAVADPRVRVIAHPANRGASAEETHSMVKRSGSMPASSSTILMTSRRAWAL